MSTKKLQIIGNLGGNSIEIDDTLTKAGQAADAKATGDAINQIQISEFITIEDIDNICGMHEFVHEGVVYTLNSDLTGYVVSDADHNINTDIDILNECNGLPVTSIGEDAFLYCRYVKSVTIPDSVTSIMQSAFSCCDNLTSVNIPNSVTSIDEDAFYGCTKLTLINIPDGITRIAGSTFRYCHKLTSINIPDGVTSIGKNAFDECRSLTSIAIPSNVTSIGSYAFFNCTSLANINIPDGVTIIDWNTFENCSSLISVTIPDSVTRICPNAFMGCTNLTDIYYTGTQEQWTAINFDDNWDVNTGNYTVHYNYVAQ